MGGHRLAVVVTSTPEHVPDTIVSPLQVAPISIPAHALHGREQVPEMTVATPPMHWIVHATEVHPTGATVVVVVVVVVAGDAVVVVAGAAVVVAGAAVVVVADDVVVVVVVVVVVAGEAVVVAGAAVVVVVEPVVVVVVVDAPVRHGANVTNPSSALVHGPALGAHEHARKLHVCGPDGDSRKEVPLHT